MLFVAEPSVLRVSTELGRLDAGAVTAGMGLRQAVEELEWLHPDLGIGTAALDRGLMTGTAVRRFDGVQIGRPATGALLDAGFPSLLGAPRTSRCTRSASPRNTWGSGLPSPSTALRAMTGTGSPPGVAGGLWLPDRMPGNRWTSFVAEPDRRRILHEDGNEAHRLRVEHDGARLYVELSGEDGTGPWTVLAVERASRRYAVAQAETKTSATQLAADALTKLLDR